MVWLRNVGNADGRDVFGADDIVATGQVHPSSMPRGPGEFSPSALRTKTRKDADSHLVFAGAHDGTAKPAPSTLISSTGHGHVRVR